MATPHPPTVTILPSDEVYEVHAHADARTALLAELTAAATAYYGDGAPIRFVNVRVSERGGEFHARGVAVRRYDTQGAAS